ncbi:hypothetical protein CANTEDRAFT_91622 [Yamadazyma tenuis ATCC 10573]|uniref:Uncharacterized protein n=1 Tax=Candida tenuis (strain ATCC 10573 / BCRC 21748 / CBS 615 / JCM 9827 / NBRC 10315 / NRRL Y-1498 / VKM Y-70) TaxID=590646 RepID=G3AW54_CANTC|nr:uncharacterized protein CANTEDRAFT_91622 [Yamadazyma tenuis ATCC 10573]EGV66456.1 hypothetical protein CANTEDRAFT_91622 [Yamadazyma tenuis ATCC 10573]
MPVTERPKTSDLKVNFGPAEALVIKSLSGSLGAKGKKGACDPFDKQPSDDTTDESSIISTDTPEMDELKPLKSIINSDSSVPTPLRSFDILSFNNSRYETPRFFNDYLSPNSKFSGMQQSSKNKHKIEVEFKHVDLTNSLVVGFLKIQGLSDEHPEITTCFKGEIINNPLKTRYDKSLAKNYSFLTENSQWGSSFTNDLDHWKRLSNYYNLTDDEFSKKLFFNQ